MTKKFLLSKSKFLIVILSVILAFSTCAFFVACDKSQSATDSTDKTYTYTETDTDLISNRNFAYGTHGKTESDYPLSSPTGWTRTADNSAVSSSVDSGVISVADASFNAVFNKLYADSDFLKIYEHAYKTELQDKTDDEKKEIIKGKFTNPEKYSDDADSFVYMLNNFSATYEKGTAQRLRSSSTVSVKKGEIYKVSVWVKTNILNGNGANIRLTNAVNGNSQAEFHIDNIKNTDWTEYTVYFVANDAYDCTFTLTLGLGYGTGKSDNFSKTVEGTVFFDDIAIEKIDDISSVSFDDAKSVAFGSEDVISVNPIGNNVYKYDMNFSTNSYFTDVNLTEKSFELDKESKTFVIKDGGVDAGNEFAITTTTLDEKNYEQYMLVSFKLLNNLNKLGSTDITVNVIDIFGAITETRKAVATFSDVSDEYTDCTITVRNNFKNQTRNFYLEIVIGPTDVSSVKALSEFATGTVKIKDIKVATGYVSSEKYPDKADDVNYKLYSFFNSGADATVALYAGYNADYEEHNHSTTYSLTPAKGNIGQITSNPTAIDGYYGIVSDHVYVKGEEDGTSLSNAVNDRLSFTGDKGYAGLINTKYLTEYSSGDPDLAGKLSGLYDDDIQPLVINNKTLDNYGFIGNSQTISASSYAKITVKLKVIENAKAFIYLVDTSKSEKEILTFTGFTVNTADGIRNAALNGTETANKPFMLEVDSTSPVGEDNWVEINFYLATGADSKSFRVEVWNGGRDGENKSQGYVIVNSIDVSTASGFSEPASWAQAFASSGNPLFEAMENGFDFKGENDELIAYLRELTDIEKAFNKEYPDQAVNYSATYVWAKTDTMIYGIFNTLNPVESDPYENIDNEEESGGCAATSDPSTFWLSFSTIVLAAALVLAIIALFVKRLRTRRKANKSDVKAQYTIKSRSESQKAINKAKEQQKKKLADAIEEPTSDIPESPIEPSAESVNDETTVPENTAEENSSDDTEQTGYVYGEVQDFGDMSLEISEENNPEEEKKDE